MKPLRNTFLYLAFILAIGLGLLVWSVVQAQFQEPSQPFPGGSPNPPVDTSSVDQIKSGGLNVGNLGFAGAGGGLCVNDTAGASPITCRRYGFDFGWKYNNGNIYNLNTGNVRVGTSTPSVYKFDVLGDINITGDIFQDGALFTSGGESNWTLSGSSLYASSTSWNVGIGVTNPLSKLSVQGSLALLRQPGAGVPPGPGPTFYLESPSSAVTTVHGSNWEACGGGGSQPSCGSDNTPDRDSNNAYSCPIGSGGNSYSRDVSLLGGTTQRYRNSVTCVAGTSAFSLRTNRGVLEFLNDGSNTVFSVDQNGGMILYGPLDALGGVNITGDVGVDGDVSFTGTLTAGSVPWARVTSAPAFITAGSTDTLTNKSGNISQWTNDSGYITAGPFTGLIQSTAAGDSYFTGGNVGIGTDVPAYKLDVAGSIRTSAGGAFGDGGIYFGNHSLSSFSDPAIGDWLYLLDETDTTSTGLVVGGLSVGSAGGGAAYFRGPVVISEYIYNDDGSNIITLDDNVNVSGDIDITGRYLINGSPLQTGFWNQSGSDIYYNAGKVGIGIATGPVNDSLEVRGVGGPGGNGLLLSPNDVAIWGETLGGARTRLLFLGSDDDTYINAALGNDIQFRIADSDKVIINSAGRVGIGTTDPQAELDVNGWTRTSGIRADTVVVDNEIQFSDGTTQSTAAGGSPTIVGFRPFGTGFPDDAYKTTFQSGISCKSIGTHDLCILSYCEMNDIDGGSERGKCYLTKNSGNGWQVCSEGFPVNDDSRAQAGAYCVDF